MSTRATAGITFIVRIVGLAALVQCAFDQPV
jgi:hypothetical protein